MRVTEKESSHNKAKFAKESSSRIKFAIDKTAAHLTHPGSFYGIQAAFSTMPGTLTVDDTMVVSVGRGLLYKS